MEYWYVALQMTLGSPPLTLSLACVDVQVWMGLCCHHGPDDGRVYLVYGSHHLKEVYTVLSQAFIHLILAVNLRIQYRRAVNQADNKAATVSIDSLINYEAVKVFYLLPSVTHYDLNYPNQISTSITKSTKSRSMTSILPRTRNPRSKLRHRWLT